MQYWDIIIGIKMLRKGFVSDDMYFRNINMFNIKFKKCYFIDNFVYYDMKDIRPVKTDTLADKFNKSLLDEIKFKQLFPKENFNSIIDNKMFLSNAIIQSEKEIVALDLKDTDFVKCEFNGGWSNIGCFKNLEFDNVLFLHTKFKKYNLVGNLFRDCCFVDTLIYDTSMRNNIFANCVFENVIFVGIHFNDTLFNICRFKNCKFIECEIYFEKNNVFDVNCVFDECDFNNDYTFTSQLCLTNNMYQIAHMNKYVCNVTNYNKE